MNSANSSQSYNDYINGSKFRFLPLDELKEKHFIVTDIDNDEDFKTIKKFHQNILNVKRIGNNSRGENSLYYIRYRGHASNWDKVTQNPQTGIKKMCQPNEYGIPDILFTYDEFYNHYIKNKQ